MVLCDSSCIRKLFVKFGGDLIATGRSIARVVLFKSKLNHLSVVLAHLTTAAVNPLPTSSDSDSEHKQLQQQLFEDSKVKVINVLYSLKTQPNMAFSFFKTMKDRGFQHDVDSYAAMIRILCDSGLHRCLHSVLVDIIKCDGRDNNFDLSYFLDSLTVIFIDNTNTNQQFSVLVKFYDALIKSYVTIGMFDEAVDALFQTQRHGILPHIFTCNFLINRLIGHQKLDMAISVYKQLKRLGLRPNSYTYSIVIKGLCRRGTLDEALDVFEEMDKAGVTPSPFAYAAYIEGLCANHRSDIGYQILKTWIATNFRIDVYAFTAVIRGFCNEMKLDVAENILLDMENMGLVPDMHCYSALICGFCKSGDFVKALTIHNDMLSKGIKTNCEVVSSILHCFCRLGMPSELVDWFNEFKELGVFLDEASYNIVIDAFCRVGGTPIDVFGLQGNLVGALKVFEEMKERGFRLDIVTCNIHAAVLCRQGCAREALDLLDYMETLNMKPNTVTYNLIIENLCIGGNVKVAKEFFKSLKDKSLDNYAAMISGYCQSNHTAEAYELFHEVARQGLLVKKSSCYKLLKNLCNEANIDAIFMLIKTLVDLGVEPDKFVFSQVIATFCRAGDMKKAQFIFNMLLESGSVPDVITYTIMMHGYCKLRRVPEAFNLFHDMKRRGIKPDLISCTVLLDSQLKTFPKKTELGFSGSEHNDVSIISGEMKRLKIRPDVICYTVLIGNLWKAGCYQDAAGFYDEMIESGLKPDVVTYLALLSRSCNVEELHRTLHDLGRRSSKGVLFSKCTISALRGRISKSMKAK